MFTVWLHCELLPQASIAAQVRDASKVLPQWPAVFVTVLMIVIVTLLLMSVAVGASKVHAMPSCTVLFVLAQFITGAIVSTMFTVWLHCELLPHASIAEQVRVASNIFFF